MPEKKSSKPSYLQRCVGDLVAKGKDKEAAFAICTSTMQKAGYLTKGPGMEQTKKGANRARHFSNMKDMPEKAAAYEKAIGRKEESTMEGGDSGATIPEMYQVLKDINALLPDDAGQKEYDMLAERCRNIDAPDEGFEDARWACQKALRAVRGDIRKELKAIADFRDYTEMRITNAGRGNRFRSGKRKEESQLSRLAAQLIASTDGGLAESKRGCGCGGRLAEASISKMNRKKKAVAKKKKVLKKVKVRSAPVAVPLTKGGAGIQSLLKDRQKLIKAVEADADGIPYAVVEVDDLKNYDESDIRNGDIGVHLNLIAEPPTVYQEVGGEVEIEVSCGGSGEDNFDMTVEYDEDYADGSVMLYFTALLGKDGKPEYRLRYGEFSESSSFRDASYFEDIIAAAEGQVLDAFDLEGLINDRMPSESDILESFEQHLMYTDYGEEDCQGSGNYYY